jgi:hypothetical protein
MILICNSGKFIHFFWHHFSRAQPFRPYLN